MTVGENVDLAPISNPEIELTATEVKEIQGIHKITAFTNSTKLQYTETTNIKIQSGSSGWQTINNIPFDDFFSHDP